jgi:hypothetical protein
MKTPLKPAINYICITNLFLFVGVIRACDKQHKGGVRGAGEARGIFMWLLAALASFLGSILGKVLAGFFIGPLTDIAVLFQVSLSRVLLFKIVLLFFWQFF